MRAVLPLGDHPEPELIGFGQLQQRLEHVGQQRVATGEHRQHHADHERAHLQLPGAHPDRQKQLDPLGDRGGVDDPLDPLELGAHAGPPSSATNCRSVAAGS